MTGQAAIIRATPDEENGAASEVEFAIAAPIKPGHVRLGVLYARGMVAAQELDLGRLASTADVFARRVAHGMARQDLALTRVM